MVNYTVILVHNPNHTHHTQTHTYIHTYIHINFYDFLEGYASTDVLWKKNELYFRSISDGDMNFLTIQVRISITL
jgi:hypothetical protein